MTNGLSGPRKQFLDVLRVLATCAVVLMHVLTGATDVTDASIDRSPGNGNRIYHSREQCRWQESIELPDLRAEIRKRRGVHIERDEE